jgi:predicted AAA+ superfamily ATPase
MYINRKIISKLEVWKQSPKRKPLILRGARQVGKSRLVQEFSNSYTQKILLNLERPEDKILFDTLDIEKLVEYLYLKHGFSKEKQTIEELTIEEFVEENYSLFEFFLEQRSFSLKN